MIYVDRLQAAHSHKWKYKKHCHLFSSDDNIPALHAFAEAIGLKREWFQSGKRPHYDITESKRKMALRMGAKERV